MRSKIAPRAQRAQRARLAHWGRLAICVVAGFVLGLAVSVGVYLERNTFTNRGFADVYITAYGWNSIVTLGVPLVIGVIVAAPIAEMATGGAFRSMWCRVDRRQYLRTTMLDAAMSGFVVAFSTMATISLAIWAMSHLGAGFLFAQGPNLAQGYYSAQNEAYAWYTLGGFPALFAEVSPSFVPLAMSIWVGFSGIIFGVFTASLVLVFPWPRLAFLGPIVWLQLAVLATASVLTPIGWITPRDALYPWFLSLLLLPGRIVGLVIYVLPLVVCLWLVFRRTERIASMQ